MPSAEGGIHLFPRAATGTPRVGLIAVSPQSAWQRAAALGGLRLQTWERKLPRSCRAEFKLESSAELADGVCEDRRRKSLGTNTPLLSTCLGSHHPPVCHHHNLEVGLVWDTFDSLGTLYIQGDQTVTASYFSTEPSSAGAHSHFGLYSIWSFLWYRLITLIIKPIMPICLLLSPRNTQPERRAINTPHHSLSYSKDESFPKLHSLSFQPDFTANVRLYPGGFFFLNVIFQLRSQALFLWLVQLYGISVQVYGIPVQVYGIVG